jgi:uncharacterized protein (TIGR02996 family)
MAHDRLCTMEGQLFANPRAKKPWRVYADLLEEHGDPTAAVIRRGLDGYYQLGADEALGPMAELATVSWSSEYDPDDLSSLPRFGLYITVSLSDEAQQKRIAAFLSREAALPRLWAWLGTVHLIGCRSLDPTLLDALRALPLQGLEIRFIHYQGGARYRLDELPHVRALRLDGLPLADELPVDVSLPLQTLLFDADQHDLSFLTRLPLLERLCVDVHCAPVDLAPLAGCSRLRTLTIRNWRLSNGGLEALAQMPLRCLELSSPEDLDLAPLAGCQSLERLELSFVHEPIDLAPLTRLPKLRDVRLFSCDEAFSVAPLARLAALQHLQVRECPRAEDVLQVRDARPGLSLDYYYVSANE